MGGNTSNFHFITFFYQGLMWGLVKGGGYFGVLHEANQIIVVVGVQILKMSVSSEVLDCTYTLGL